MVENLFAPYDEFIQFNIKEQNMQKVVFNMEPFTCPSCVKKIENTIGRIDGVNEIKVMFNSGRVRAEFDSSKTNADVLENTIIKLGYPVLSKKVS